MIVYFVFQLPGSIAHVPGPTEDAARAVLRRHSFDGAPVDSWPRIAFGATKRWPPEWLEREPF